MQVSLMQYSIEHEPWTFSEDFQAFLEQAARHHTGNAQPTAADKAAVLYEGNMASAIVDQFMESIRRQGYVECNDDDGASWTLMPHTFLAIKVTIPEYTQEPRTLGFNHNAPKVR